MHENIPVVILAGGMGTRLSEETGVKPKPMVEIGGRPMLWHIMKLYSHYGFHEFVIALGYKGYFIKEYFLHYRALNNDISVSLANGDVEIESVADSENWLVHLIDTGSATMTGGRVKRVEQLVGNGTFMLTYGDGIADVNIPALLACHRKEGRLATVTAVRPPARFGEMILDNTSVRKFTEKPQIGEGWINGGFFVFEPAVLNNIEGDETSLEAHVLERLAAEGQLTAYRHEGFWQCMDTLRDVRILDGLWEKGIAPWNLWNHG